MDLLSNVKLDSATLLGSIAICVVVSVAYEILKERRNALRNPPAPFRPTKTLALKDELVLSMLDEVTDEGMRPCYVITDPSIRGRWNINNTHDIIYLTCTALLNAFLLSSATHQIIRLSTQVKASVNSQGTQKKKLKAVIVDFFKERTQIQRMSVG